MMILDGRVSMCGFGIKKTNAKKLIISLMVGGGLVSGPENRNQEQNSA